MTTIGCAPPPIQTAGGSSSTLGPSEFIATYLEPQEGQPLELQLILRDLALHMGRSAALNRKQLRTLMTVFRVGALLLVAEVLAWIVALLIQR